MGKILKKTRDQVLMKMSRMIMATLWKSRMRVNLMVLRLMMNILAPRMMAEALIPIWKSLVTPISEKLRSTQFKCIMYSLIKLIK